MKHKVIFVLGGDCDECNNEVMACVAGRNPGKSTCCSRGDCGEPWKRILHPQSNY